MRTRKIGEKHPDYEKRASEYSKARDFGEGQAAVKGKLDEYLPLMDSHKSSGDPSYKRMHQRAWLYEATVKTVEALVGMLFRKDPTFDPIEGVAWFNDVDGCGTPLTDWVNAAGYQLVNPGRLGALTDYPDVSEGSQASNLADAESLGQRPFTVTYTAESIWDWDEERPMGSAVKRLTYVVLHEDWSDDKDHGRLRELLFNDDNQYEQAIYRYVNGEWKEDRLLEPKAGTERLSRIPFRFANWKDSKTDPPRPLLMPLVNVEASWYIANADKEVGLKYCARPTPVVTEGETAVPEGLGEDSQVEEEEYVIGSEVAWVLPYGATAKYLEFQGQGMDAIFKDLESKEDKMGTLGARMLLRERRQVEAEGTAKIHRMGEASSLSRIANSVAELVLGVLEDVLLFEGKTQPEGWSFVMNRDFFPSNVDAATLTALLKLYISGGMDFEDLHFNLVRGEVREPGRTAEDVLEGIERDSSSQPVVVTSDEAA